MKIKVKFFSSHRDAVGEKEIEVEIKENSSLNDLLEMLSEKYPKLKELKGYTVLSLNHRYADGNSRMKEGDEVAIFPPLECVGTSF